MKLTKKIGMLLLAIWLILMGAIPLIERAAPGSFPVLPTLTAILALVAGGFILVDR